MATDTPDWTTTVAVAGDESKLLLIETVTSSAATIIATIPASAVLSSYAALVVTVQQSPLLGQELYCLQVNAKSTATLLLPSFVAPFGVQPGTSLVRRQAIVPCSSVPGQRITLLIHRQATGGTVIIRAWGLTTNPGVQVRSDGRTYPLGTIKVRAASGSAGSTSIILTPPATLRIFLQSMTVTSVGTNAQIVSGTTIIAEVGNTTSTSGSVTREPPGGILLPAATSLQLAATTAAFHSATVAYDIVI